MDNADRHRRLKSTGNRRCSAICTLALAVVHLIAPCTVEAQDASTGRHTVDAAASGISSKEMALVRAAEQQRIAAIEKVYGAVVAIYGNDRAGGGSGVLIDAAGYAVTNHHVVAAAGADGWAGLADGKLYRWKLVGTDPGGDVAVIQLRGSESFPTAPLGDSDQVRVGDWSMAMGNPFTLAEDQRPTVTLGIVSGVNRYQPGEGLNQLVYGNCIQVDSSINPGNSGGPLFNLRGEIIGINGRGSFQERGRVNVGLGYAISSNQVRYFLPELLAAKIAQHGTLDAQFGNRDDGVICHTLNLDSPAAKAGLKLGDCLVTFEGVSVRDANQLASLISIYPAGWPVTLGIGEESVDGVCVNLKEITVRLTPLPYESTQRRPQKEDSPEQESGGKPDGNGPLPPKPAEDSPDFPKPPVKVETSKISLADAGKVLDLEQNRTFTKSLFERYRRQLPEHRPLAADSALGWRTNYPGQEEVRHEHRLLLAGDGRAYSKWTKGDQWEIVAFDGETYWQHLPDSPPRKISPAKASRSPWFSQAMAVFAMQTGSPPKGFGPWQLDGADKARGRLAYRVSASDEQGEQFFLWLTESEQSPSGGLSVGRPVSSLLTLAKSAVGIDEEEPIPAVLYGFDETVGLEIYPEDLARGVAENLPAFGDQNRWRAATREFEESNDVDDQLFKLPDTESGQ